MLVVDNDNNELGKIVELIYNIVNKLFWVMFSNGVLIGML